MGQAGQEIQATQAKNQLGSRRRQNAKWLALTATVHSTAWRWHSLIGVMESDSLITLVIGLFLVRIILCPSQMDDGGIAHRKDWGGRGKVLPIEEGGVRTLTDQAEELEYITWIATLYTALHLLEHQ
ncbi:hypothetical protein POX_d06038 [Penicillium oxalicum]|uniref:Uncharacterized protein n=1 Tax=Penicillium oxalicum (strain 114-2 / CGMCC 5302) TaxID=933388 RepID=S7ZN60_PENO1|nr:hypothetical protein POX_d06038 [Penicillium oxalicum]EPS31769.1 hypothetical protein PDE_06727 [Penicillium oxalicum 114-2]KAI2790521.1 hypothetical protein POX_d06038 [Penicillium oxalicum]